MEPKDLVKVWSAPDNSRLTLRQMSIRLPLHVAARVSAIAEMFPTKSKTEIIGGLLASALDQFEEGLSAEPTKSDRYAADIAGVELEGRMWGERGKYGALWQKHLKELEAEFEGRVPPDVESKQAPGEVQASQASPVRAGTKRALRGAGASARPSKEARPAPAPRGDQGSRQRGAGVGRRRR